MSCKTCGLDANVRYGDDLPEDARGHRTDGENPLRSAPRGIDHGAVLRHIEAEVQGIRARLTARQQRLENGILCDSSEYQFGKYSVKQQGAEMEPREINQAIFDREIGRLRLSCERLDPTAKIRIIMTHYPPIGADLADSVASKILETYHIQLCVFGHLHGLSPALQFGTKNGIRYVLTSCDHINFMPIRLL